MVAALLPGAVVLLLVVAAIVLARRRLRGSSAAARGDTGALGREPVVGGMSMRELAFVAEATRARRTAAGGVPVVVPGLPTAAPAPTPEERAYAGKVHCPACGSELAGAGPLLRYVTRCRACDRRLGARVEGARLIVEVHDA